MTKDTRQFPACLIPGRRDTSEGDQLKLEGMARAARKQNFALEHARLIAKDIARSRESREVTMDDVNERLKLYGYPKGKLGAAAGSLFKTDEWEDTGRMVLSAVLKKNHSRRLVVWRLH